MRKHALVSVFIAAIVVSFFFASELRALDDPLPAWNDGTAKQAILAFVAATTDKPSPKYVPPEERTATLFPK